MKLVYIASPYSIGSVQDNVLLQIKTFKLLSDMGYCPIAPLLGHFVNIVEPIDYEKWIEMDFAIIQKCDILLRLGGESYGADREVAFAEENGIKVVYSIEELV